MLGLLSRRGILVFVQGSSDLGQVTVLRIPIVAVGSILPTRSPEVQAPDKPPDGPRVHVKLAGKVSNCDHRLGLFCCGHLTTSCI